jgi:hypothetical protein
VLALILLFHAFAHVSTKEKSTVVGRKISAGAGRKMSAGGSGKKNEREK